MRRLIVWIARLASYFLFRRVEVVGADTLVRGQPTLLVANHFNGFVDPVVIAMAVGRLPRFIAKATLTNTPGLGPLMRSIGVVFVQRRQDGEGTDNRSAFHECHAALAEGDVVGIFPEGTTHDRPRLDPIRTGAARIILGVDAGEGPTPVVVPVGLTYPDKLAVRSSVLVQFGAPIDPAEVVGGDADESDHQAVRDLTDAIHDGLRSVSPDFEDLEDRLTFELGAEIATRSEQGEGSLIDRARTARRVAEAPADEQAEVRVSVGRYAALLTAVRLTDAEVADGPSARGVLRSAVVAGLWVAVLGSLVVSTALVNVVPMGLVLLASLRTKTPVTKGTVRVLVGLVAFPAAWVIGGVLAVDGVIPVTLAAGVMALGAVAALALIERAVLFARALMAWYVTSERAAAVDALRRQRGQVTAAVTGV
jgi:glycerol-3-phosphate O-acyltransferase/dihydroxyacetone phosphate acyltransferase